MLQATLPQQVIHVKRKKHDEPVDLLYIENEHHRRKRRVTDHGLVFRRLQVGESSTGKCQSPRSKANRVTSAQLGAELVPHVRVTSPGDELNLEKSEAGERSCAREQQRTAVSQLSNASSAPQARLLRDQSATPTRRFHLARSVIGDYSESSFQDLQLPGRLRPSRGPVLVEQGMGQGMGHDDHLTNMDQDMQEQAHLTSKDIHSAPQYGTEPSRVPLKRPGATQAEMAWRARNWKQGQLGNEAGVRSGTKGLPQLADSLQKFAEEVADNDMDQPQGAALPGADLRYKPRAQPRRNLCQLSDRRPSGSDDTRMEIDHFDESEYVYDTYVSYVSQSVETSNEDFTMHDQRAGLIIINAEDQPLWEAYMHDEESEDENKTDEEDENAEDYYGADYPEEEVDHDDEHGIGVYQYRKGTSDDEEFDSGDLVWSDEEEDLRYPWKRHPWDGGRHSLASEEDD